MMMRYSTPLPFSALSGALRLTILGLGALALGAGCLADGVASDDAIASELVPASDSIAEGPADDAFGAGGKDEMSVMAENLCGGFNLAWSGSSSASSTFCSATDCFHASRIHDGFRDTTVGGAHSWSNAAPLPQWVEIDLGGMHTFNHIELYTSDDHEVRDYRIQYWNGHSWADAVVIYGNTQAHRTHRFHQVVGSRVRVLGLQGPDSQPNYVRVNELEIFFDCVGGPGPIKPQCTANAPCESMFDCADYLDGQIYYGVCDSWSGCICP